MFQLHMKVVAGCWLLVILILYFVSVAYLLRQLFFAIYIYIYCTCSVFVLFNV
jgi:hypothetical protein